MAIKSATGTSQLAARSAIRCIGACFSCASCTILISFCSELSLPTFVARISTVPKRFIVPQNSSSPMPLSTGRDSPVIIDWSTEVSPLMITPSTGMTSPGRTRSTSSTLISSTGINRSPSGVTFLPRTGVSAISLCSPFFALSVVISSNMAPSSIIKATSPAANKSPIATAANIATVINSAEDILLIPGLWIMRQTERYKSGSPQIITASHAGSTESLMPSRGSVKLITRHTPPSIVIGSPARKSLICFIIIPPP